MKLPWPAALAGGLVAVAGAAGLIRGAMPQSSASGASGASTAQGIVVTGTWVREPTPPTDAAAAYFTVRNTGDAPDRLTSVVAGAGRTAMVHTVVDGRMSAAAAGVVVRAHADLVLAPGSAHVMIEGLYGRLAPGQTVNLELQFATAGTVDVTATVIGRLAPAPTSGVTK